MKKVMIEFYALPETTIPAQGTVKLTAPNQVTVHTPTSCTDVLNEIDCQVSVQGRVFTIITAVKLDAGA
jgi:hypothetical protein